MRGPDPRVSPPRRRPPATARAWSRDAVEGHFRVLGWPQYLLGRPRHVSRRRGRRHRRRLSRRHAMRGRARPERDRLGDELSPPAERAQHRRRAALAHRGGISARATRCCSPPRADSSRPTAAMPADWASYVADTYVRPGSVRGPRHRRRQPLPHAAIPLRASSIGAAPTSASETIDVYYVHNPETQLAEVDRPTFLGRMRAAFQLLEAAVGERQDPLLRHRDLERLSAAAVGAGLPVTRGARAHRAGDRGRSAPLPRRPGPLQPRDDRSVHRRTRRSAGRR